MNDNSICSFCKHVFTDQEENDPYYGLACPHCDFDLCENCYDRDKEWNFCPSCGKKFD